MPSIINEVADAFADALTGARACALGLENENGVRRVYVESENADAQGLVYVHELPGRQPFSTQAYLKPGAFTPALLRYGLPCWLEKDSGGDWVVKEPIARLANEFLAGVDTNDIVYIPVENFLPGLLSETSPRTMRARVMGAWYTDDNAVSRYFETQETVDFSTSPLDTDGNPITLPTVSGQAKYVLVQLNQYTGALSYKQGATVDASLLGYIVARDVDAATGSVLPQPDENGYRVGYVKLFVGVTSLKRVVNLWAAQEIFTKGSGASFENFVYSDGVLLTYNNQPLVYVP